MAGSDSNSGFGGLTNLISTLQQLCVAAGQINQTIGKVFPQGLGVSNSAAAGSASLPASPAGFLNVINPVTGQTVKIAFYN